MNEATKYTTYSSYYGSDLREALKWYWPDWPEELLETIASEMEQLKIEGKTRRDISWKKTKWLMKRYRELTGEGLK